MGGFVEITLRERNGKIHKMSRYTGSVSHFIDNDKLFEMDRKHIEKYTQKGIYDDEAKLAPEEYGIIVVDLKTKTILSCNDYTSFGKTSLVSMRLDNENRNVITEDSNSATIFKRLFDKGYVIGYYTFKDKENLTKVDTWGEVENMIKDERKHGILFKIDPPGWTIVNYKGDSKSLSQMKDKVKELGFELTESEESDWNEWIERIREDEDQDQ